MWIRKESILYDRDAESKAFNKDTTDERPLGWNEFRILQSSKSKDLASNFVGNKSLYRQTGIKIKRQQLVQMNGHEFKGEIVGYSIWLPNNSSSGPITDALKGFNPARNEISAFDIEHDLPQLYQLRKIGIQSVTQFEHLASTWNCLMEDNEPKPRIGVIDPETISNQMALSLRVTSEETKGIETFKKRMHILDHESFEGYNPSETFVENVATLIW